MRARARVCTGNLGCRLRRACSAASLAEESGSRDGVMRTGSGWYAAGDGRTAAFGRAGTVESARREWCVGRVGKGFLGAGLGWGSLRALVLAAARGERNWSHSDGGQRMRFIVDVGFTG